MCSQVCWIKTPLQNVKTSWRLCCKFKFYVNSWFEHKKISHLFENFIAFVVLLHLEWFIVVPRLYGAPWTFKLYVIVICTSFNRSKHPYESGIEVALHCRLFIFFYWLDTLCETIFPMDNFCMDEKYTSNSSSKYSLTTSSCRMFSQNDFNL